MRRLISGVASVLAGLCACSKDVVLPDPQIAAVCGDGLVEAGEGCDTSSPGCVACQVAPEWTCPENSCSPLCGDGVVGQGATCQGAQRDDGCDMTGFWAVRETDYACDSIFNNPQTSSNWYLYELAQSGDTFRVVSDIDCGVHVTGSATIDYTIDSLRAVMYENPMDGRGAHGQRHGTSAVTTGGCSVSLDRWYMIRGAVDTLLPPDFSAAPTLASLPPLPQVADPTAAAPTSLPGATDPDGDGFPGIAVQIAGLVSGVRDTAQRVWKEYRTPPEAPVVSGALQITLPGTFELQENVLHVSQCGKSCALITTAAAASTHPVSITLAFLGKTFGSPRVSAAVAGLPGKNVDTDLATCANLRRVLPHDPAAPAGACHP